MLPPADLLSKCLRCGKPLGDDEEVCERCGANRDVERQVYAQIVPAIGQLRGVFGILVAVCGVVALVVWNHASHLGVDGLHYTWPLVVGAGLFAVLWILAPRLPLATGLIGLSAVAGDWLREIVRSPLSALSVGPGLLLRCLAVLALAYAVRAGFTARRIRRDARERIPTATVRT